MKYLIALTALIITTMNTNAQQKILVAYFSATGTTKSVAEKIATAASADIFRIEPKVAYTSADLNWNDKKSRSSVEMNDPASRPELKSTKSDIAQYDIVYIGYPIWWYVAPHIINSFIEAHDLSSKTIIPFATSGGSPIAPTVADLREHYPSLTIKDGKLLNRPSDSAIRSFVDE